MNDKRPTIILVTDYINIFLGYVKGLFKEAYIGGVPIAVQEKYLYSLLFMFIGTFLQFFIFMVIG